MQEILLRPFSKIPRQVIADRVHAAISAMMIGSPLLWKENPAALAIPSVLVGRGVNLKSLSMLLFRQDSRPDIRIAVLPFALADALVKGHEYYPSLKELCEDLAHSLHSAPESKIFAAITAQLVARTLHYPYQTGQNREYHDELLSKREIFCPEVSESEFTKVVGYFESFFWNPGQFKMPEDYQRADFFEKICVTVLNTLVAIHVGDVPAPWKKKTEYIQATFFADHMLERCKPGFVVNKEEKEASLA